ncbi:unnamed protein product [Allacma fusca]|uniref:Uncharacterized protein n=1 Tax=Allacma fusca TaxID=39272 RepID=A0A8J2KNP5_9HEXA|nr:unnamed protein product [Allacma fusca]
MEEYEARGDELENVKGSLKSEILTLQTKNHELRKEVEITSMRIDRLARKSNLMIYGFAEISGETKTHLQKI